MAKKATQSASLAPKVTEAIIMFADMIGSSVYCDALDAAQYDSIMRAFQETAAAVLLSAEKQLPDFCACDLSVRGDEACLITYRKGKSRSGAHETECAEMARVVVRAALDLQRAWLLGLANRNRIERYKEPIGLGIGINWGAVAVSSHVRLEKLGAGSHRCVSSVTPEGYSINLAKRIEGAARDGRFSRIMVGQGVYNLIVDRLQVAFDAGKPVEMKGFIDHVPVYEIKSAGHVEDSTLILDMQRILKARLDQGRSRGRGQALPDDAEAIHSYETAVANNPRNFWLIMDVAHYYYDRERYGDAIRSYAKALALDDKFAPAHMYLGRCHYRLYDDDAAEFHLQRAVELNAGSARSNNFLGVCLRRRAVRLRGIIRYARDTDGKGDHLSDAYELLGRAMGSHERAIRRDRRLPEGYLWAPLARGHTLAELAALTRHDPTPGRVPGLSLRLADAQTEVQHAYDRYVSDAIHNERKQRFLFLHTMAYIEQQRQMLTMSQFGSPDMAKARKLYGDALDDLMLHRQAMGRQKFCEKLAEIEWHFGSSFVRPTEAELAHRHYDRALAALYVLQNATADRCQRAGGPPKGALRDDRCDRACTCLPCWWEELLEDWRQFVPQGPEAHWATKMSPDHVLAKLFEGSPPTPL